MTELEREEVLGARAERIAEMQQRRQLREMVKLKERRENGRGSDDDDEADGDEDRARRKPKAKGPASKYDKLKRSRAERGKKKERVVSSMVYRVAALC